jgi:hypothetical protein
MRPIIVVVVLFLVAVTLASVWLIMQLLVAGPG